MHITKLEVWDDTGYVEGGVEVPSLSDTLPDPAHIYMDIHPSKGDVFSAVKIKDNYEDLINASYLRITYSRIDYPIYAWIDAVSVISDSPQAVTRIDFHIDLWRTYLSQSKFGYGLVSRRPRATDDPIQNCSYRYRSATQRYTFKTSYASNTNGCKPVWVVFSHVSESDDNKITKIRRGIVVVDSAHPGTSLEVSTGSATVKCPSLSDIVTGEWNTKLGINAQSISSAFVSPYAFFPTERFANWTLVLKTSTSGTKQTDSLSFQSRYISSLRYDPNTGWGQTPSLFWSDNRGESGVMSSYWTADMGAWLENNGGVIPDNISANINKVHVSFMFHTTVSRIAKETLGDTYTPVDGDTLTINRVYINASYTYPRDELWMQPYGSGTLTYELVLTYSNGTWTNDKLTNDVLLFDQVPTFSYTYDVGASQADYRTYSNDSTGYGYIYSGNDRYPEQRMGISIPGVVTTDTAEWVVTDCQGVPVGSLPWGKVFYWPSTRLVVASNSAYLQLRLSEDSLVDGTCFNVPLPSLDVCSNSWSDYVYSGQRDYDIQQRAISARQSLVNGVTSTLTGGVSNYAMSSLGYIGKGKFALADGSTMESFYADIAGNVRSGGYNDRWGEAVEAVNANLIPARGGGMNPRRAGLATIGAGTAGSLIDYAASKYFNQQLQSAEDTLQAKQIDSIQTPGEGWDWLWYGTMISLVRLVPDGYSLSRFAQDIEYNGIQCSEPTPDCTSLIQAGGPLRISQLIVTGDIPVGAKKTISQTLDKGVRITTKHTETTDVANSTDNTEEAE